MYVGRLVWNRLRYVKNPDTGKRVSRLNPESEWMSRSVPQLRIVPDEIWAAAKSRQQCTRRRRTLPSGCLAAVSGASGINAGASLRHSFLETAVQQAIPCCEGAGLGQNSQARRKPAEERRVEALPSAQKPWIAIVWFAVWGVFQSFAIVAIINGTWKRPAAFPPGVYESLIYPDTVFVPLYFLSAILLYRRHPLGRTAGLVAGGGIVYVMIYLLALSGFSGAVNLSADAVFLALTVAALWQIGNQRMAL